MKYIVMGKRVLQLGIIMASIMISCLELNGQVGAVGARSVAMAGASTCLEDIWAGLNNPAGLAGIKNPAAGTSLEQRYMMKELGYYALASSIPAGKGVLGVSAIFTGFDLFIDQTVSLAYGMNFGTKVKAGAGLVYSFQRAGNESKGIHLVSYKIGTIVGLSGKAGLSFTALNPFQLSYKSNQYATVPSVFALGITYRYSSSFILCTEFEKNLDYPVQFKCGLEYSLKDSFKLRGGIRIYPAIYSFGVAFRMKKILIDLASVYYQYLGFTPIITLQYDFK